MASTEVSVPISSITSRLTMSVRVVGVTTFKARLWLGLNLIKMAARVIGCAIEVDAK